jgi:hypothetical protein
MNDDNVQGLSGFCVPKASPCLKACDTVPVFLFHILFERVGVLTSLKLSAKLLTYQTRFVHLHL